MFTFKSRKEVIPRYATASGENVVQVDILTWSVRGWKGEKYAAIFSHRKSKIDVVLTLNEKKQVIRTLETYLGEVIPQLQCKPNTLQTDASSEFLSKDWVTCCVKYGIKLRHCPVDHQAMNGQTERSQGVLTARTRAMLRARNVPQKYWPLAIMAAVYLKNRTPNDTIPDNIPIERALGEVATTHYNKIKVFGCRAYVSIPKALRKGKAGDVRWKGIMVGYAPRSPEYLILDPKSGRIRTAYNVCFQERIPRPRLFNGLRH